VAYQKHYIIIIFLLLGIILAAVFQYTISLKERNALKDALEKEKARIISLAQENKDLTSDIEKQKELNSGLISESAKLKEGLLASQGLSAKLEADLAQAERNLEVLNLELNGLRSENLSLKEEKEILNLKASQAMQERDDLMLRFNSIPRLKRAIRELKRKGRSYDQPVGRSALSQDRREITQDTTSIYEQEPSITGNRGFIIRDGAPMYSAHRVKIEVSPASIINAERDLPTDIPE
jgi:chromosome segregation ATPase